MKDITNAVLNGDYDKPLHRGMLHWRTLPLGEGETKHIIEVDDLHIYLKKAHRSAIVVSVEGPFTDTVSVDGILELLNIDHIFWYRRPGEGFILSGFELRSLTYEKLGGFEVEMPKGTELNCVLTDASMQELLELGKQFELVAFAIREIGEGRGCFHRITQGASTADLLVLDNPDGGIVLQFIANSDDNARGLALDLFNYLTATCKSGIHTVLATTESEVQDYLMHLGFRITREVYAISHKPEGESNAN